MLPHSPDQEEQRPRPIAAALLRHEVVTEPLRRFSKSVWGFALGFTIAALMTVAATVLAVTGSGPTGGRLSLIWWLLIGSLLVCLGLAALIVHRVLRVRGAVGAVQSGARLHLRFVGLFSAAAVVPAIAVAAFMGAALSLGLEQWFDARITRLFEAGAGVGARAVSNQEAAIEGELSLMIVDLNRAAAGLESDTDRYLSFLGRQAEMRAFPAAYVISSDGTVLASVAADGAPDFATPSSTMFTDAEADPQRMATFFNEGEGVLRALARLEAYPDAYLYVAQRIDRELFTRLRDFDTAITAYRAAAQRRGELQTIFAFAYLTTALLVLLGAVRLGLANASRIAEPIGRLAHAADRVAAGDLAARVHVGSERDEIDGLSQAFNGMTAQLQQQRDDLLSARNDAEARTRFTEAVLGGVSAGVIGLDRDGRVVVANDTARQLLQEHEGSAAMLLGRRLVDVAPEFGDVINGATPLGPTPPRRIDLNRADSTVHLSVRMSRDASGGLVLTFDDMTRLIAAQRQEAWKDVARRIAHEIKNPLTPIQLSADRLKRKFGPEITSDPATFHQCADTILRQVGDLGRMVDEFAAFARMPTPVMALADLSAVARNSVDALRIVEPELQITLTGADQSVGLVCDAGLIGHVFTNILKNAAEGIHGRTAASGAVVQGQIAVRLRDLDFGVQIEVQDNGIGFPPTNRARLIEPYVTTRAKGTGLGLAIVARIIEDHAGLLELEDAPPPGPGALVRIVLPRRMDTPAASLAAKKDIP